MMTLKVTDLELMAYVGWTAEERRRVRRILINIEFIFKKLPKAVMSDDLQDTPVCYQTIELMLRKEVEDKEFKLIEYLGYRCFQLVKEALPNDIGFNISVTKFLRDTEGSRTVELSHQIV